MFRWILVAAALHLCAMVCLASEKNSKELPRDRPPDAGGDGARTLVRQALTAESDGDNASRADYLRKAWLADQNLPEANWHLARVREEGQWLTLAEINSRRLADEAFAKYRGLRAKAAGDAGALISLARWCKKQSWSDVARLHYAQALALGNASADAQREAVKELDLRQVGGQWITGDELAARQEQAAAAETAVRQWLPRLKRLQEQIDGDDFDSRRRALAELKAIDDPSVIPAIEALLHQSGDRFQEAAVKRFANFPHYEATQALVAYAVLSEFAVVRQDAAEALRKRPMHEYVPLLLAGLVAPLQSQYQIAWDERGQIRYTHALLREGTSGNLLLISQGLARPQYRLQAAHRDDVQFVVGTGQSEIHKRRFVLGRPLPEAFREELNATQLRALEAESQVQLANTAVESWNVRLLEALERATNQQLDRTPLAWWNWWQDYNEYYWPRPTSYFYQSSAYDYYAVQTRVTHLTGTQFVPPARKYSCFAAGTLIRTETGQRPIESIEPGDRVLAQDPDTGEMVYRVVLRTTLRPPAATVRITAGGEPIVTTLGHPFWVNGHGWKMAKELATGDLLHGLGGAVPVEKVESATEQPAYNLVVDGFNTYFVGRGGLLVHDNELRRPTRARVPGLVVD